MKLREAAALSSFLFVGSSVLGLASAELPAVDGYLQTRFDSTGDNAGFSIRRAKLWFAGPVPGDLGFSYKLQGVYRSSLDTGFYVQDVYLQKQIPSFLFRGGRFVPDFSLQRLQPDSFIPVLERALVINRFSFGHDGSGREAGAQTSYETKNKLFYLSAGAFNGNQNVPGNNTGTNLLYVTKAASRLLKNSGSIINLEASFAARHINNGSLFPLTASTSPVSGSDVRTAFSLSMKHGPFEAQGEYLNAESAGRKSWGYYAYAADKVYGRFQALGQVEANAALGEPSQHWASFGLNYLFSEKNKIMSDYRFRTDIGKKNPKFRIQYQMFLF